MGQETQKTLAAAQNKDKDQRQQSKTHSFMNLSGSGAQTSLTPFLGGSFFMATWMFTEACIPDKSL